MAWWPKAKLYNETNNDKRNDMLYYVKHVET